MLSEGSRHIVSWKEILSVACIWMVTFVVGMAVIYLPGVYYDAVYPDYIAAIGAFPGVDNDTYLARHVGLPMLGNYYHGTMTAGLQYIILKCIGHASQLTLRIANLFYFAVMASLLYILCRRVTKSLIIPLLGTLLCVTAPNVLTIPRTQYFIMLIGCIFFFSSLFLIYRNMERDESFMLKEIFLAGVCQGLAFYGYFTYLFFTPASMILIVFFSKGTRLQKITAELIYLLGVLIGSIGYFIGYYDLLITNLFGDTALTLILLWCGIFCMLIYLIIPVYMILKHENDDIEKKIIRVFLIINTIVLLAACAVGIVILFLYKDRMLNMSRSITNLMTMSQTRNKGNRFLIFWQLMYMLVSNKSAQDIIFGERLNGLFGIYFYLGITMTALAALAAVLHKRKEQKDSLLKYIGAGYLYLAAYYIFTLPISLGMQPQHFVAVYFLLFFIIMLDIVYVGRHLAKRVTIFLGLSVLVFGMCVNITTDRALLDMLYQTEGRGMFSSALDWFAEEARSDEEKDNKIYVFPQWGFYANFVYLTENSCKAIRDADIEYGSLQEKLESGYILVIAAFDKKEISDLVENLHTDPWEWNEVKSKEGDYVFTYCTIRK